MAAKRQPLSISFWYLLAMVLFVLALLAVSRGGLGDHDTIAYSDFKALLAARKVSDLTIGNGRIEGTVDAAALKHQLSPEALRPFLQQGTAGAYHFSTAQIPDPQLLPELEAGRVHYQGAEPTGLSSAPMMWLIPGAIVLFVLLFMRRGGFGGAGVAGPMTEAGRSQAKVFVQQQTGVRFTDVEGIDEAKQELVEIIQFLKDPGRYRRLGGHIPKGVLIVGAPGTGKTLLAKAVAGEAGVPFLFISGSEFVEMFVGVGAARVRDLFRQAQQAAPCIVFVDELDALGKARGISGAGGNDEREQTLNQLLVEMDGFATDSGVMVLAATNRPEILDPALLRPGRFDRHIAIDRPDVRGREKILRLHARRTPLDADVDLCAVAAKTPGFAGADLANIVNEAALHAAHANRAAVGMVDFDHAIDRVVVGLEKRNRVMNPREKETVAYHEAGHALIAELRPRTDRVSKISIIPRGIGALGFTQQRPTEDRYLLKHSELLDRLDVLLGGRVAEELVYGDVSTGAQDDLQKATDMARHMVTQYGMSEHLGQVTFDAPRRSAFLEVSETPERVAYSERTAQAIDEEISALIGAAHDRVVRTLRERRATLEALARLLLEKEVLGRAELDELLKASTGGPPGPRALGGAA